MRTLTLTVVAAALLAGCSATTTPVSNDAVAFNAPTREPVVTAEASMARAPLARGGAAWRSPEAEQVLWDRHAASGADPRLWNAYIAELSAASPVPKAERAKRRAAARSFVRKTATGSARSPSRKKAAAVTECVCENGSVGVQLPKTLPTK